MSIFILAQATQALHDLSPKPLLALCLAIPQILQSLEIPGHSDCKLFAKAIPSIRKSLSTSPPSSVLVPFSLLRSLPSARLGDLSE